MRRVRTPLRPGRGWGGENDLPYTWTVVVCLTPPKCNTRDDMPAVTTYQERFTPASPASPSDRTRILASSRNWFFSRRCSSLVARGHPRAKKFLRSNRWRMALPGCAGAARRGAPPRPRRAKRTKEISSRDGMGDDTVRNLGIPALGPWFFPPRRKRRDLLSYSTLSTTVPTKFRP